MRIDRFLALSNSALKVVRGENYSKVGIILEVNNKVVKTSMAKKYIADYTNTSLNDFAHFVVHPSFKRLFS